jgi:hypothetical protein
VVLVMVLPVAVIFEMIVIMAVAVLGAMLVPMSMSVVVGVSVYATIITFVLGLVRMMMVRVQMPQGDRAGTLLKVTWRPSRGGHGSPTPATYALDRLRGVCCGTSTVDRGTTVHRRSVEPSSTVGRTTFHHRCWSSGGDGRGGVTRVWKGGDGVVRS